MQRNILNVVKLPPLNCSTVDCVSSTATGMGAYARHLFDVVYLYGIALTRVNSTDSAVYDDMSKLIPQFVTSFNGNNS